MQHVRRPHRRDPRLWLPVAIICTLLVLGFLLFEVLDMDGSDFPRQPANAAAKLVDPPQNDGRRGTIAFGVVTPVDLRDTGFVRTAPAPPARGAITIAPPPATPDGVRIVLARASLSDGPAAG